MTVYSKVSYAARNQQYSMCTVPIVFLNDDLKAELGMMTKK
jgi:hypothetical protein